MVLGNRIKLSNKKIKKNSNQKPKANPQAINKPVQKKKQGYPQSKQEKITSYCKAADE